MKAGGPAESGVQGLHNKCLAVDLPNNLGFQGVSEGLQGLIGGYSSR